MWKGSLTFALVTVPVRLYSAIESRASVNFHLLHGRDDGRIRYKRICEKCGEEVAWDEITRGYEIAEGRHVELTDEDFERAALEDSQTIDIQDFVAIEQVDPKFFERPYFLEPQKGAERSFALVREALKKSGKAGIAKFVLRKRQALGAIVPQGDALVLESMRFADEIRAPEGLNLPPAEQARERELALAIRLIDELTTKKLDLTKYKDDYKERVEEIIRRKVEGKEIVAPEAPEPTRVTDLMAVLERSLAERGAAVEKNGGAKRKKGEHPEPKGKKKAPRARKAGTKAKAKRS